jgi:hypothetical protein
MSQILVPGMTYTPPAGKYLVNFTGACKNSNLGGNKTVELSIFSGGVQNIASILNPDNTTLVPFCCVAIVTVDGAQAIEARFGLTGTPPPAIVTIGNTRSLTLIGIG